MTRDEFQTQLSRLQAEFKDAKYTVGRVELLWQICEDLPAEALRKLVTHFIASFRHAPLVKDFAEGLAAAKRYQRDERPPEPYTITCGLCNDAGHVQAILRHEGQDHEFIAKCTCTYGRESSRKLPVADELPVGAVTNPFPVELFKPNIPKVPKDLDEAAIKALEGYVGGRLRAKVEWWQARLAIAEQVWGSICVT